MYTLTSFDIQRALSQFTYIVKIMHTCEDEYIHPPSGFLKLYIIYHALIIEGMLLTEFSQGYHCEAVE